MGIQMNREELDDDDFKLKKTHLVAMFFTNYFSALRVDIAQY